MWTGLSVEREPQMLGTGRRSVQTGPRKHSPQPRLVPDTRHLTHVKAFGCAEDPKKMQGRATGREEILENHTFNRACTRDLQSPVMEQTTQENTGKGRGRRVSGRTCRRRKRRLSGNSRDSRGHRHTLWPRQPQSCEDAGTGLSPLLGGSSFVAP